MSGGKKQKEPFTTPQVREAASDIKTVTPFQQALNDKFAKFHEWETGTGAYAGHARDITEAPGIGDALDIYGSAESAAQRQRIGDPSRAFSANLPGYNNQLQHLGAMERYNERAHGLSDAIQRLKSEAYGIADTSIERDFRAKNAYADAVLGANRDYYNRPRKPPLWQQIAGIAAQGLGAYFA